jgi:hypothetical protein
VYVKAAFLISFWKGRSSVSCRGWCSFELPTGPVYPMFNLTSDAGEFSESCQFVGPVCSLF